VSIRFLFIYFLIVAVFISIGGLFLKTTSQDTTLVDISKNQYYENYLSKERIFLNMISQYTTSLKALQSNQLFYQYIVDKKEKKKLLELFLHNKKSFQDITQIRYLDKNGMEKLRINGNAISLYGDNAMSSIVKEKNLQNKFNKNYFQQFIQLKPLEIGYSKIDLNRDNGKITLPKEPTLRIGIGVYGNNKTIQGVLIYNISLRNFFKTLHDSSLYNISICDNNGDFLVHHDFRYGLLGNDNNYSLKNEFPKEYKNILKNDEYRGSNIYSHRINIANNKHNIKFILKAKYTDLFNLKYFITQNFFLISLIIAIIFLPLVYYFIQKRSVDEKNNIGS